MPTRIDFRRGSSKTTVDQFTDGGEMLQALGLAFAIFRWIERFCSRIMGRITLCSQSPSLPFSPPGHLHTQTQVCHGG